MGQRSARQGQVTAYRVLADLIRANLTTLSAVSSSSTPNWTTEGRLTTELKKDRFLEKLKEKSRKTMIRHRLGYFKSSSQISQWLLCLRSTARRRASLSKSGLIKVVVTAHYFSRQQTFVSVQRTIKTNPVRSCYVISAAGRHPNSALIKTLIAKDSEREWTNSGLLNQSNLKYRTTKRRSTLTRSPNTDTNAYSCYRITSASLKDSFKPRQMPLVGLKSQESLQIASRPQNQTSFLRRQLEQSTTLASLGIRRPVPTEQDGCAQAARIARHSRGKGAAGSDKSATKTCLWAGLAS